MPATSPEALERDRQRRKERARQRRKERKAAMRIQRKRPMLSADKIIARRMLGPLPAMSKAALRDMLRAAVDNTR